MSRSQLVSWVRDNRDEVDSHYSSRPTIHGRWQCTTDSRKPDMGQRDADRLGRIRMSRDRMRHRDPVRIQIDIC